MPMWCEVSRQPLSLTSMGRRPSVAACAATAASPTQNVGNGVTHLFRLGAIRATLGSPCGLEQIRLCPRFGVSAAAAFLLGRPAFPSWDQAGFAMKVTVERAQL